MHHFKLQGDFIELNVLLKLLALAHSGGGAKALIAEGAVRVDGAVETRVRRKLREGCVVRVGDEEIRVLVDHSPGSETPGRAPIDDAEPRREANATKPAPRKRRVAATAPSAPPPWERTAGKPAR
ncbi:MAG: RNA-binding S4 domain-containing protein [Sulfuritalea sp.]|nr:RNA-binding S4 domain-containing protein [Sulfuritalea sp.]